jgi:serine/threonine-protein kinase HipA
MGALRFKTDKNGAFLNDNRAFSTPPLTALHELERASLELENDLLKNDNETLHWLNMLLAPGSSLGGARPKAGVIDKQGALWIAKFPSKTDSFDVGAWEMIVNELARKAGLNVTQTMIQKFHSKHHTFLSKRFDRTINNNRVHFASAMTLLGCIDGVDFQDGVSYLDLAGLIIRKSANTGADLEELFRRIVFNICVKNTDDHLRNHGFLLTNNGWTLSPVYDINPNPKGIGLKLNITENENTLDLALAQDVAPLFRISNENTKQIIHNTLLIVSQWNDIALKYKIPREERDRMSDAFAS